jgi:hypothetical protein
MNPFPALSGGGGTHNKSDGETIVSVDHQIQSTFPRVNENKKTIVVKVFNSVV